MELLGTGQQVEKGGNGVTWFHHRPCCTTSRAERAQSIPLQEGREEKKNSSCPRVGEGKKKKKNVKNDRSGIVFRMSLSKKKWGLSVLSPRRKEEVNFTRDAGREKEGKGKGG